MRAVRIVKFNGPTGLRIEEVAAPVAAAGQVAIDVKAVGLNRADLLQTMGLYPAPAGVPADLLGMEYAGVVAQSAHGFEQGERVMGLVPGAAFAERIVASAGQVLRVPKVLSDAEAAAIPEAFMTAWDAVWLQAGIQKGQSVLIHAVGSGVGTAAVQLARALGVKSVGTSRSAKKLEAVRPLGLDVGLLCGDPVEFAKRAGNPDVCLDLVGGAYFPETIAAMAPRGTVMIVGITAGPIAEVPLFVILGKRLKVIGTTLRGRADAERVELARRFAESVVPLFQTGALKAVVSEVRPMAEVAQAFASMAKNETFGKTVLTW